MPKAKKVRQYALDGGFIQEFEDSKLAAKHVGASRPNQIINVCNYSKTHAHGFMWRYACDDKKLGTEDSKTYNKQTTINSINEFDREQWKRNAYASRNNNNI